MAEQELTPEELLEQIRQLKVSDLLLSTVSTVVQLGYAKLGTQGRDLEQAKLAIESIRVLVPMLEGFVPEEVVRDFNQVTADLQLAYAKAVEEAAEAQPEPPVRESGPGEGVSGEPGGSPGQDGEPEN